MKKQLFSSLLVLISLNLFAQDKYLKDVSQAQELSNKIVNLFKDNKISDAFTELKIYWPLPENEMNSIEEKTIKYLNLIDVRYGKCIGSLKVKNETINDIAVRETYLIRYEYSALRIIFTFYKNDSGWIINAFKWDDSFTEEFK
jgi:hypothetical protein